MSKNDDLPDLSVSDIAADDAFLDALARGEDPSEGRDPLAALLLELREDTDAPMPAPPIVANVHSMDHSRRRQPGVWRRYLTCSLVGAAAATLVIAGSGAALYRVEPGSPLWGLASRVFNDRAAVVELSTTLDDMGVAVDEGKSMEELRALLNRAWERLRAENQVSENAEKPGHSAQPTQSTQPSEEPPVAPSPETLTLTVTETVTMPPELGSDATETESTEETPSVSTSPTEPTPVEPSVRPTTAAAPAGSSQN